MSGNSIVERVLELARWAPSGDNTQPWRFEVIDDQHFVVHAHDTREHCVYDLEGEASQISIGALLENIEIAASANGRVARLERRPGSPPERPLFDVWLTATSSPPDPLHEQITIRSVQRRPLSTRPISAERQSRLRAALRAGYELTWFESWPDRWRCARLMFRNAHLRLTIPEAFEVHRSVIEWGARHSHDRVPDQALGADALSLVMMRHAMQSWQRVQFANRFLAGTWLPRLQLDLLPSMACAAHWVLLAPKEPQGVDDFVAAGRQVQRLWLTATALGLQQQPEMTPLIFARYHRRGVQYTSLEHKQASAGELADQLTQLLGDDTPRAVWMGRLGYGPPARSRSLRRPLTDLMLPPGAAVAQNR